MSGGHIFVSFQRFMEDLFGLAGAKIDVLQTTVSEISSDVAELNSTATEIAVSTERGRQNAGGRLRIADGVTSGSMTTITPSPAPGAGESIRIRFVYFSPQDPNTTSGDTEWRIDNSVGAEIGFRCEFSSRIQGHFRFELGEFFHEITTASFRIRRTTGADNTHFYIGYTIQDTESALP